MKKRFFSAVMTLLVSVGAFAQGNGIGCLLYTSDAADE